MKTIKQNNEQHSSTAIVTGKAVNWGDREGMQLYAHCILRGEETYCSYDQFQITCHYFCSPGRTVKAVCLRTYKLMISTKVKLIWHNTIKM